jgi:hypothetical protein
MMEKEMFDTYLQANAVETAAVADVLTKTCRFHHTRYKVVTIC